MEVQGGGIIIESRCIMCLQSNWVLAQNSNILITISVEPDVIELWYFKPNILSLKYQRFTPLDCKAKGVRKLEFVARRD